jgi:uncharacterized coiled-coil protein SlyX
MIDIGLYAALGFLIASLLALMLAPPLWNRAVRLTTRRLESTMPMSITDIQADKDQLRAEYAIRLRRVEVALEKAKERATSGLVESNKRRIEIAELRNEFATVTANLEEKENANRVLEQTIRRRLPDLETRLKAAKDVIAELEAVNTELRNTVSSQSEALKSVRATVISQRTDIDRLRGSIEGDMVPFRSSSKSDATLVKENQMLNAELSRVGETLAEARAEADENHLLREALNNLAEQILAVARGEDLLVPVASDPTGQLAGEFATQEAHEAEPFLQQGANGTGAEEDAAESLEAIKGELVTRLDVEAEEAQEAQEAEEREEAQEAQEDVGEEDQGEPKSPLAKRFAARRARRRALKIERGARLSDRLRGHSAEISE